MATTKLRSLRRSSVGAFAALGIVASLALSGCGGSNSSSTASVPTNPSDVSGDLNILVSSATGSDAGFKAIDDAFSKKYPNVKVNLTSVPNENYAQTKSSRLTAGSTDILIAFPKQLPSYVPATNEGDDARLADAGGFVDLTNQPFMSKFNPSVLKEIQYNGKNYTVPTGLSYYTGMMYNKKIFDKYGLKIPTTWDEFTKLCDTLKSKGVTPLGIAGKDSAGINMLGLVQTTYPTADDKNALAKGLYDYSVKLNEGKQLEVMKKLSTLYGYAEPNFAGVSYATMTSDFVNGKFAMMSDGTWNVTTLQTAGKGKLDFGYFPLPASNNAADNKYLGGKVELSLAVASNAKNQPAALAWLATFADNYKLFNDQAGFAPAEQGVSGNPFYSDISSYTSTFEPAWDTIWIANTKAGPAAQFPFNWQGLKPMGTQDAQGAADAAEKDWEAGK